MAANQEPPGRGEAEFHGLFMLFLNLTGEALSGVTQPYGPPPCLYPVWHSLALLLDVSQKKVP